MVILDVWIKLILIAHSCVEYHDLLLPKVGIFHEAVGRVKYAQLRVVANKSDIQQRSVQ